MELLVSLLQPLQPLPICSRGFPEPCSVDFRDVQGRKEADSLYVGSHPVYLKIQVVEASSRQSNSTIAALPLGRCEEAPLTTVFPIQRTVGLEGII